MLVGPLQTMMIYSLTCDVHVLTAGIYLKCIAATYTNEEEIGTQQALNIWNPRTRINVHVANMLNSATDTDDFRCIHHVSIVGNASNMKGTVLSHPLLTYSSGLHAA